MIHRGKTQPLDEVVGQVLKQLGIEKQYKEHRVLSVWPEVVGQMIASRTKQICVADGKLFVSFTSAVVRNEIALVKEGVQKALNDKMGGEVIREIIIK
ncbi:MAG: DUF721 domain-containing protein [Culturomica sp.]|jgi:predicted nucleic acid-binding Zn ribbon protein|nr:DUF721 domain-containing protein [Culturomica sp.]